MKEDCREVSVALLMSDLKKVKEISLIFRKIGVVAHYYEDLQSFWHGVLEKIPTICFVDVLRMSEGSLFLKNHPLVKASRLPLSFYYARETRPLVHSTYEIFHHGLLTDDLLLEGQIKNLLKRLSAYNDIGQKERDLSLQASQSGQKLEKIIEVGSFYRQKDNYHQNFKMWCHKLESLKNADSFYEAFRLFIDSLGIVKKFSIVELAPNKQKIVSPPITSHKYRRIPILWPGQPCEHGLDEKAQNMASEVAISLFEGELMALGLKGASKNPEVMIFLEVSDEDFFEHFDWENFEYYLGGFYNYFSLKTKLIANTSEVVSGLELLSILDGMSVDQGRTRLMDNSEVHPGEQLMLVDVNLQDLMDLAFSEGGARFYFGTFYHEFLTYLHARDLGVLKVAHVSLEHLAFILEVRPKGDSFSLFKSAVARFSYWKYFEQIEMAVTHALRPIVQMVPLSLKAYLNFLNSGEIHGAQARQAQLPLEHLVRNEFQRRELTSEQGEN